MVQPTEPTRLSWPMMQGMCNVISFISGIKMCSFFTVTPTVVLFSVSQLAKRLQDMGGRVTSKAA